MNDEDDGSGTREKRSKIGGKRAPIEKFENLAKTGWLSMQPDDFQSRILGLGRWTTIPRGRRLYAAGDDPDALYGLETGLLDLAIPIVGGEECVIHRGNPGFWIGDGALIPGTMRTLSVEAAAECRLFRIEFSVLRRHLAQTPADWEYLHRLATLNGILSVQILSEVISLPARARVARLLLRVMSPDGNVASTHDELARLAAMSRATFRRSLSALVTSGAIKAGYKSLTIVDRAAVQREANTLEE